MPAKDKIQLELKRSDPLNADVYLLTYALGPQRCRECLPGQFFNMRPLDSTAPLLRRPISICDARPETGELDLLVRVYGEGTRQLSQRRPGALVDAVGPLGAPYLTDPDPARPALLVAGGVGVAPLLFLARRIRRAAREAARPAPPVVFCYGARRTGEFVLLDELEENTARLVLATEDGSLGHQGFVTQAAVPFLEPGTQIFVCGPPPMMQAMLNLMRERGLEGQFSLENQMGCGVGACMGCVVPGREGLIRVCCDGPVVSSEKIDAIVP